VGGAEISISTLGQVAMSEQEKPKQGDRVKLIGTHKYAGYTGFYLDDRDYCGRKLPVVKVWELGTLTFVLDPENQMRKL